MNSRELQRKYPSVYLEFASNAEEIFSMPHTITLLWGTACALWGTAFEQKIPLNCFFSIKKIKEKGIKFGKYIRYNWNGFENIWFDRFETPGNSFLRALEKLYPHGGYEICILNELSSKTPDIVSFLAIIALEFEENENFSLINLSSEIQRIYESKIIRELVKKAESIRIEYNETTKWLSSMSSIFCWLSKWNGWIIHQADICLPLPRKDEAAIFSQSESRKFRWTKAKTVLSGMEDLPFEIIILHPKSIEKNSHWYWEMANSIIWADSVSSEIDLAMFATSWSARGWNTVENSMKTILSCCEMLTLNAISGLKRYNEGKIVDSEQFWLFEKAHEWSKYILWKSNFENHSNELKRISEIHDAIKAKTRWNFLVFRTGNSIDMNYVILLSKKIPHIEISEVSRSIEEKLAEWYDFILSTPKDGIWWTDFWRIDIVDLVQDKTLDIIRIKRISWGGWKINQMWSEEFWRINKGITADIQAWKIYVDWRRVTSKEIPSQHFSTEILFRILNERVVSSKKLPHSTYSTSKNEMISKILMPLKRLSKSSTWTDIEWSIDWTEAEFQIKILNPGDLDITLVDKVRIWR